MGKKDVVLVLPNQYVEFVTKFEDFANDTVPYMYHCHLLHHEDDGMMGSFIVIDTTLSAISKNSWEGNITLFPNPSSSTITLQSAIDFKNAEIKIINVFGQVVLIENISISLNSVKVDLTELNSGIYVFLLKENNKLFTQKFIKQ